VIYSGNHLKPAPCFRDLLKIDPRKSTTIAVDEELSSTAKQEIKGLQDERQLNTTALHELQPKPGEQDISLGQESSIVIPTQKSGPMDMPIYAKKRGYMPYLVGALGGVIGVGIGVGLIMTGIFAPFGAGLIALAVTGAVSAVTGFAMTELLRRGYNKLFGKNDPTPAAPHHSVQHRDSYHIMKQQGLEIDGPAASINHDEVDPGNSSKQLQHRHAPSAEEKRNEKPQNDKKNKGI